MKLKEQVSIDKWTYYLLLTNVYLQCADLVLKWIL